MCQKHMKNINSTLFISANEPPRPFSMSHELSLCGDPQLVLLIVPYIWSFCAIVAEHSRIVCGPACIGQCVTHVVYDEPKCLRCFCLFVCALVWACEHRAIKAKNDTSTEHADFIACPHLIASISCTTSSHSPKHTSACYTSAMEYAYIICVPYLCSCVRLPSSHVWFLLLWLCACRASFSAVAAAAVGVALNTDAHDQEKVCLSLSVALRCVGHTDVTQSTRFDRHEHDEHERYERVLCGSTTTRKTARPQQHNTNTFKPLGEVVFVVAVVLRHK